MNRKIAVFANAWSTKTLSDALAGIKEGAKENDMDVFVFLSHAAPGNSENEMREEKRIYQLPELEDFDGVIVFSATMNFMDLVMEIRDRAADAGIPAVSVGIQVEGMGYIGTDNMQSMSELVEHLVTEHQVRTIRFMAGPKGNEHSDIRIEATRRVFAEHGIPFEEDCIVYGDWSSASATAEIRRLLADPETVLPDAILCANDNLAIVVCVEIEKLGRKVPEDVIVSGFDGIYDGQFFYPAICTVGQDDHEIGCAAFQTLMQGIHGEVPQSIIMKTHFIPNESCGCHNEEVHELRLKECRSRFFDKMQSLSFGWSNKWIAEIVLSAETEEDIREKLNDYLSLSETFHKTAYFLQDRNAREYLSEKGGENANRGYSEELTVWTAVQGGEILPHKTISRRELIPGYKKREGISHMYLFMPLHFEDRVFGYAVTEEWLEIIESGKLKVFLDGFNSTLDKLKQNLVLENLNARLKELYTRDSLTGLYNRFGFETEGIRVFEKCKKYKKPMVLMFTDINRMKVINDYYGHLQGDVAIKTVAEAIQNIIPKQWLAIRFGGDEFLVIGECGQEEEILSAKTKIAEEVRKISRKMSYPFYLSISCGYHFFIPEAERTLDSYIMDVDEKMYDIKAEMHRSDAELRAFVERCKRSRMN